MNALQRNDWPGEDAGVLACFMFARPEGAEQVVVTQSQHQPTRVRCWAAREEWLALTDFSNSLHSPPYRAMLNCDAWKVGGTGGPMEPAAEETNLVHVRRAVQCRGQCQAGAMLQRFPTAAPLSADPPSLPPSPCSPPRR